MKNEIIEYLKNLPSKKSEGFNRLFDFFRKTHGASQASIRMYNTSGFTEQNFDALRYDLMQLHGIKEVQILTKKKIEKIEFVAQVLVQQIQSDVTAEQKLREEFPFLSNDGLPDIVHVLTGRMISAWKRYQDLHGKIQKAKDGELKISEENLAKMAAAATKDFQENQDLHAELNAYKESGKFLLKHPMFRELALKEEIEAMTNDELLKFNKASSKYFSDNNKELTKEGVTPERKAIIENRIAERREKLALVNKKLGIEK